MATMAAKNYAGSPAATALGLGDSLAQQLADQQDELRKKRATEAQSGAGASQGLFSPATLALLGNPNASLNG
jgi:hypothetical protein